MTRISPLGPACSVLLLTALPASAQWFTGTFWYQGGQVQQIMVTPNSTFSVEARIQMSGSPAAICGYDLGFYSTSPQLTFLGWADAHNWDVYEDYPYISANADFGMVPPPGVPTTLGTATFRAPATEGNYALGLDTAFLYDCDSYTEIFGNWTPLTVVVGSPPLAEPGVPPVPPGYAMGNVVNGNFEANGGSLAGWTGTASWHSETAVYAPGSSAHVARLHAEGEWMLDPFLMIPWYISGSATLEQTVFIPLDATGLTFTYTTRTATTPPGMAAATITIGTSTQTLANTNEWTRQTVVLPSSVKGKRTLIRFTAADNGAGCCEPLTDTMRLYLDYVSVDGTTILQTTTWSAGGGGTWEAPSNWNPAGVPDNSTTLLHDVVIPQAASGAGAITLNSARTVQTLTNTRRADALRVQAGGTLNVVEDCSSTGATLQIAAGGAVNIARSLTLAGGALGIHPDGDPSGAQALTVGGTLTLSKDPVGSAPALVTVLDGVLQASNVTLNAANFAVVNSPGFSGASQVNVAGEINLYAGSGGTTATLTLNPGTILAANRLFLGYSGSANTVNVQSATIAGQYTGSSISGQGTLQFTGQNCLLSQMGLSYFSGQVLFTDAGASFSNSVSSGGTMRLVNSTVTLNGEFSVGGTLAADAASTLVFKKTFSIGATDPGVFDLKMATVKYAGADTRQMDVPGIDLAAVATGFDNNFAIGTLLVDSGTLQLRQSSAGHALYVRDLVVMPGATLDLNGVKLYYLNTFTSQGGTVTGGQVRQALARPQGLPSPSLGSGYTATATVCGYNNTVTGGPAQITGYSCGPMANASSQVRTVADTDRCTIDINLSGDVYGPIGGLIDVSGSLSGPLSLPPSSQYPLMTPMDVVVYALTAGGGGQLSWSATVFRNQNVLTTLGPAQREARLGVIAGETGLRLEVAISDGCTYCSLLDRLQIVVYALPRPPLADLNGDGLVESRDLDVFADCATDPSVTYASALPANCQLTRDGDGIIPADLDRDHDVDQGDFGLMQRCYSGPSDWADVRCEQ